MSSFARTLILELSPTMHFYVFISNHINYLHFQVRDGEMVAVELVATDLKGTIEAVLSLGCVQYDSVRRVHEARASQTVSQRLSQTNLLSIFGTAKVSYYIFQSVLHSPFVTETIQSIIVSVGYSPPLRK